MACHGESLGLGASYQFTKSVLGLLVDRLHALIHSLLLLFQHLGVCALLETLEDLSINALAGNCEDRVKP